MGTRQLPDDPPDQCGHCGAPIWLYSTVDGDRVALEDAPGPYLIDGTKAYRSEGRDGLRDHWEHCDPLAGDRVAHEVLAGEFLFQ